MRKLFWILLLGNTILFAGMQRGWFGWGESGPQAQPPLNGELIQLAGVMKNLPAKVLPERQPTRAEPVTTPVTPVPAPTLKPRMEVSMSAPVATSANNAPVCIEWGDFSGTDLTRATAVLATLKLGNRLGQHEMERDIGYWVYIPPLRNKAAVNKKIGELKELGISEYFVVQAQGRWHNAISMGVFKTNDAAQNFLDTLRTKGVHSAKVGERASKLVTTVFRIDQADAATAAAMTGIQKDFPGSELKNVPCNH